MKFTILSCLFLATISNSYGQHKFTLNGKVPQGLNDQKIYLRIYDYYSKKPGAQVTSAIVHNGAFVLSGTINKPCELANVYILNKKGMIAGNANIVLEAKINQLVTTDVHPGDKFPANKLLHATIVNSKANYISGRIDSTWYHLSDKQYEKLSDGDKQRNILKAQLAILAQYPNEYYTLLKLYEISRVSTMVNEQELVLKHFNALSPALKASDLGKEYFSVATASMNANNGAKAGKQVPQFNIKTDKGQEFSNSSLKGQPYVIAFSATWCIPCQEYQKKLVLLYNKYKSKRLQVVYFNLDDNAAKWKKEITDNKLSWINVSENTKFADSKIAKQFNAAAIPLYLVVDKQGKIIYNGDEMKDYNYDRLEEYIKKAL